MSGREAGGRAPREAATPAPGAPGAAPQERRERPWAGRSIHVVGVGGAGMSGYARAAHELGASVTGSDQIASRATRGLREDGVLKAAIGHAAENVPAGDAVELVYSSAVGAGNPERTAARARGLRERPRAELLAELSAMRRTIAVAGTHGKTTTASMIAHALLGAGMDPGWLVGADIGGGLAGARWSEGEWLVIEADESDRSMLSLNVQIAVLTNVELDHADAFGSLAELREAFRAFLDRAPQAVIWDRPDLLALRSGAVETFALPAHTGGPGGAAATRSLRWRGRDVELAVPGRHNALDALAALEAARLAGADPDAAVAALAAFRGAARRFQLLGRSATGALVYDDYAHHPTEVAATLTAARALLADGGRLVAVFQPHLFSRTARFAREFGSALALADVIVVLDVYAARERAGEHPGVSGLLVARAAARAAAGRPVYWLPGFADAEPVLQGRLHEGDLIVAMGAGDVDTLARRLVREAAGPDGEHR
ncbi:MAG: UDP-N-acetylmuramate--L-alanine ligase [Acidobacteriota bacterium]|nr:UDP-N-acetylmuramate--L-alanine ligase [Acidobacteriota bacterium]